MASSSSSTSSQPHPRAQKPPPAQVCRHFVSGSQSCKYGTSCRFLHPNDMATTPRSAPPTSGNPGTFNPHQGRVPSSIADVRPAPTTLPCRYFSSGSCKFGLSCKYSHQSGDLSRRLRDTFNESDVQRWLISRSRFSDHDNIAYLASSEGLDVMVKILNKTNLSRSAIDQLILLLTRLEFRSSLLKQATDKVYNALIGSQFLSMLHSHIRTSVEADESSIEPFVLLCEEIMSRTSEGWKEVPLDELRTLAEEAGSELGRDLNCTIGRLLEHRAKKKRMKASDGKMEGLAMGLNFRNVPIIPSMEQLLSTDRNQLPVNLVGLRYSNVAEYLGTHFRLMQEDCVAGLRDGISELRKNSKCDYLHVYRNVCLHSINGGTQSVVYCISFRVTGRRGWEQTTSRLMYGSLLCISCDNFRTFLWAVVANRNTDLLAKGLIEIQVLEHSDQRGMKADTTYLMAESSAAYFEAYSHVLRTLQKPEMDNLPFQEHLVYLEPHVKEPTYLKSRNQQDVYDFECAFPLMKEELTTTRFHILQTWPEWASSLDRSQVAALKHGLTKRLALIQGPPGTGKTFIGLMIVKVILNNLGTLIRFSKARTTVQRPILLICYTNHALDQFMKGIYADEKNIIRVGERSKCPELEECNLHSILRMEKMKSSHSLLHKDYMNACQDQIRLKDQISECTELMKIEILTETLLHRVATEEQIHSLFYNGCNPETVLQMWLNSLEKFVAPVQHMDQKSNGQSVYEYNPYNVLVDEENESDILEEISLHNSRDQIVVPDVFGDEKGNNSTKSVSGSAGLVEDDIQPSEVNLSGSIHTNRPILNDSIHTNRPILNEKQFDLDADVTDLTDAYKGDSLHNEVNPPDSMCLNRLKLYDNQSNTDIYGTNLTQAHEEPEWIMTTKNRTSRPHRAYNRTTEMMASRDIEPELSLEVLKNFTDMWSLGARSRSLLHKHWLHVIREEAQEKMHCVSRDYEEVCRLKMDLENEIQLSLMRKAKVVGMTTSRAARCHNILESLEAEIIVIEEAAEVLESHVLSCLSPSTKHLILIGDHLQLRPSVAVHELAVKNHLDVSMFERLVKSGIEFVTLKVQRRMRPDISKLVSSIYPMLTDHPSTFELENVKGLKSNVFFFNHDSPEEQYGDEESSRRNTEEAELVVELCSYLLKQGYNYSEITVLSMYKGQTREIVHRLACKLQIGSHCSESTEKMPRVSSVDDYQGEECKIIILSLVRSNKIPTKGGPGKIGFLKVSNRVCVALSRAKNGLFIFGNGKLLAEKSELWNNVIKELQSSESYGNPLILSCQNHSEMETKIFKPNDFLNVRDGGCDRPCEYQLSCGHVCPRKCHPYNHDMIVCPKRCPHKYDSCDHQCQSLCHGFTECSPCKELVVKELPQCGHAARIACSTAVESVICNVPCPKLLDCTHKCRSTCGRACISKCYEPVEKLLVCGHTAKVSCYVDPLTYVCRQPCKEKLPECHHTCRGTCGTCKQGQDHIPCRELCNRVLPCGHLCKAYCHNICPPCSMPCQKRCIHSRCPQKCGYLCVPCMEPCGWMCKHYSCTLLCHEPCERPPCNEPCTKLLTCGHSCMGLCGETCPNICSVCNFPPDFKDIFSQMSIEELDGDERFIKLHDCMHVFEVTGLDSWMHMERSESGASDVLPKQCPQCRIPVLRSLRYGNHVKAKLNQIAEVKRRIISFAIVNEGIRCLQSGKVIKAVDKLACAIESNFATFETYFGLGSALYAMSRFKCAAYFMIFIVKRSPLVKEAEEVESSQVDKKEIVDFLKLKAGRYISGFAPGGTRNNKHAMVEKLQNYLYLAANSTQADTRVADPVLLQFYLALQATEDVSSAPASGVLNAEHKVPEELQKKLKWIIRNMLSDRNPALQEKSCSEGLAMKAMRQWASVLTRLRKFEAAKKACQAVLARDPGSSEAADILSSAVREEERREIVEVMMREVGGRGHWYQCPNGHYYVVGECGGPMQLSTCPDCKATVGGEHHTPADGNRHSDIDGSSHSVWSNQTGLGQLHPGI